MIHEHSAKFTIEMYTYLGTVPRLFTRTFLR